MRFTQKQDFQNINYVLDITLINRKEKKNYKYGAESKYVTS